MTILIDADGCPVVDLTIGNTAQFPPSGLSTAPANLRAKSRRKRRLRSEAPRCGSVCGTASALPKCSIMSGCGTRIVLRGQKPLALCDRCPCFGSLYPPPAALTFAAQSIICAFCLAAAAPRSPYRHLKLCGIASSLNFPTIAFLLNIDPIYKTGALWQQRAGFVVAGQGSGRYPQSACLTKL